MAASVLFVCTGNTCRSPMAEALARARGLDAESAGIAAQRSDHAAPFAARILQNAHGLSLESHTPQHVEKVTLSAFEHAVAMDPSVAQRLRSRYEIPTETLVTWTIPDPYGGSLADYRLCLEQIEMALTRLLDEYG